MEDTSTNTESQKLINWVDRNTIVWWFLILTSVILTVQVSAWGSLFWLAALLTDDLIFILLGKSLLFSSQLRIRRGYQWIHTMYDNTTGSGRDLGFNLVSEGELSQVKKYEHLVKELKLEKGMTICDVGCGYGDWLKYCRDVVGCKVVGINITPEQADYARREYGLDIVTTNWKKILTDPELQKKFYNQFDAITFMDTVEHYVSMEDRNNLQAQKKIYGDMCAMTHEMLKKDSKSGRFFMSCLHQTRRSRNLSFYFHSYFMDRMYSGHYPFLDEGPIVDCEPWFKVLKVEDQTEDYRLTGVRDRKHFQAVKLKLTTQKITNALVMLLLDPFVIHRILYYRQDSWMWFYGDNPYADNYDSDYRKKVSFVLLYWVTFEMKAHNN